MNTLSVTSIVRLIQQSRPLSAICMLLLSLLLCSSMLFAQNSNSNSGSSSSSKSATPSTKQVTQVLTDAEKKIEEAGEKPTAKLDTPADTITTFIKSMYDSTGILETAALTSEDLENLEDNAIACLWLAGTKYEDDRKAALRVATALYRTMNRIELIDFDQLQETRNFSNKDYRDEGRGKYEIVWFPRDDQATEFKKKLQSVGIDTDNVGRIALERNDMMQWKFDQQTVENAIAMYEKYEDLEPVAGHAIESVSELIESALPRSLVEGNFIGVKYWQWLLILILIFLGLVIDLFFRTFVRATSQKVMQKGRITEDMRETVKYSARPFGLLAAAIFWIVTLKLTLKITPDENFTAYVLYSALRIYIAVIGTVTAWRFVDLCAIYFETKAKQTSTKFDDVLIPLLRKTFKVFVVAIGLVYAANALNIPIAPLLASLGIASVGISFAMKDTVENFFGSVAVLLDRPFDVGDWVVIDAAEGIVEQVGFRSTRIRTFYNSQITIPNANLVRAKVDNYGRRKYRRWKTDLCVQYDTTPEQLIAFTEGVRELIRTHPYTRKDYYEVYCNDFGDSSLNILLYVFFEVPDWNTELRERERLFIDIVRLADALGVSFAFPTRTLHLYNEDKDEMHHPSQTPLSSTERRANILGVHAAQKLTKNQPWRKHKPGAVVITGAPTNIKLDDAGNPIIEDDDNGGKEKKD
ncbi:mechanosensitive ion channel family protein [Planctomycetota bacterium]|nr:mechanosensitive ion channel family protein [Planctomycetota bacterium]